MEERIRDGVGNILEGLTNQGDAAVGDHAGRGEAALGDATNQGEGVAGDLVGDAQAQAEGLLDRAVAEAPQDLGGVAGTVGDLVRKVTGG